jgi:membrane protein DedA with SNARE-associated domain
VTELIHLLNQYGYIILIISLMLELIIVPIPNEALMSYVGVLCFQGKMNLYLSILCAGIGGILGVSISYWIGNKLGVPFFRKYGRYIHMGPEKMEKMSKWYEKYGKVLLIFSFFIPGVRHVASIISGVIKLPFRSFMFFSYIGVFLWVGTLISLGNILGPQWDKYQGEIKKWLVLASIIVGILAIFYFVIRTNKEFIKEAIILFYESAFKRVRSFLKIKFIIIFIFILFIAFFTLMVGMTQDLIANEFGHFDVIVKTIVTTLFNAHWLPIMQLLHFLSSWTALAVIALVTVAVIIFNQSNKWLELLFFMVTLIGSYLFSIGIRWLFHFMLNGRSISLDFPNEQAMLVMSVYGFFFVMIVRHSISFLYTTIMLFVFLFILLSFFLSTIFISKLIPSDLLGGYVFSAVWVTGMIFSLEMFRFLNLIKKGQ